MLFYMHFTKPVIKFTKPEIKVQFSQSKQGITETFEKNNLSTRESILEVTLG